MTDILLEPVCSVCLSSCVSLANEKQPPTTEPSLVDMISECFNFQLIDDDIHPKNICECCISDVRTAYRFKRNYEQNIKLKENGLDDFIESLSKENWELDTDFVKKEPEDISEVEIAKENEPQILSTKITMTDILLEPVCSVCLSSSVSLTNIFAEKQPPTTEPSLVDMISECFNFQLIDDDKHPKNILFHCLAYGLTASPLQTLQDVPWTEYRNVAKLTRKRKMGNIEV
ncbi:hypothetical protein ACLKA7_015455 [Drosophila subpalustris]